ncbi:MAG: MoaD/ThiS family protein [Thermoleophilia bacterium]|nr:MoaD/ThiS family protein [Thermoleophilia bacterium]
MKVRFHATMRRITGVPEMDLPVTPGEPVSALLGRLFAAHPSLQPLVLDDSGQLRHSTGVLVNGRPVRLLEGLDTALSESDTVTLLLPLGGG